MKEVVQLMDIAVTGKGRKRAVSKQVSFLMGNVSVSVGRGGGGGTYHISAPHSSDTCNSHRHYSYY